MNRLCVSLLLAPLLLAQPSHAIEIDFSAVLMDLDGKPLLDGAETDKDRAPLTLGRVGGRALMGVFQEDAQKPGDQKRLRGDLGIRIYHGGKHDLTAEEIAQIKEYVGKAFAPLVISRTYPLLDGKKP